MKNTSLRFLGILAAVLLQTATSGAAAEPPRRVLSLNGTWQIAEGKMDQAPAAFERTPGNPLNPFRDFKLAGGYVARDEIHLLFKSLRFDKVQFSGT